MVKKTFLAFSTTFICCCSNPIENVNECIDCQMEIYCNLPQDETGTYFLQYNENMVQTFTSIYAETECGWSKRIAWDSNYKYRIGVDWVSLINPASMTTDDGKAQITCGVWREFIGYTITFYGGYMDDCENHHVDSLKIKVI